MAAIAEPRPEPRPATAGTRIASAAAILLGGFLASRLVGFTREALLGARFGTSADYDLYLTAFRIPDAIFTLVAGGALGSSLVPVFAEYRATKEGNGLSHLASAAFNVVSLAAGLAAALGIVFAPQLVPLLGAGFDAEQHVRLAALVRVMLLQPVFFGMGEVISRYLNVHQHFLYPALAPVIYNLSIIAGALVLGPSLGTLGVALGVTAGALAYLLVQVPAAAGLGFRWRPALDLGEPGLRQIAQLSLPRLIGQGAVQLSFIATTRLASFLPRGGLAALNYAFVLMMLPLGTFAMSLAGAAFPTLADRAARGQTGALAATARRTLGTILFLMVPCALGLVVAGLPLVQALLQRGAFTEESSRITAAALAFYAAGLPAHGAIEILARTFYALQDTRTPVAVSVVAMVANVMLAYVLAGPLGYVAIALALSASATAEAVALALLLRRRLPDLLSANLVASCSRTGLAGAALVAATVPVVVLTRAGGLPALVQAAGTVATGGLAYVGAAYLLRSPDLQAVTQQVRSRLGRGRET